MTVFSKKDNARFVSSTYQQEGADGDWINYTGKVRSKSKIELDSSTTSTSAVITSAKNADAGIADGNTIILTNSSEAKEVLVQTADIGTPTTRTLPGIDTYATHKSRSFLAQLLGDAPASNFKGSLFGDNGTKFYLSDHYSTGDYTLIRQYDVDTPYNLQSVDTTTQVASKSFGSTYGGSGSFKGFRFYDGGTKMLAASYIQGSSDHGLSYWTLSTAWDISTVTLQSEVTETTLGTSLQTTYCALYNADGSKLFVAGYKGTGQLRVDEFDLSSNYDVSTASNKSTYIMVLASAANQQTNWMDWNDDGTVLFLASTQKMFKLNLDTAYDISSTSSEEDVDYGTQSVDKYLGGRIDGTRFLYKTSQDGLMGELTLPGGTDDISQGIIAWGDQWYSASGSNLGQIYLSPDGSQLYWASFSNDVLYYADLDPPYALSGISSSTSNVVLGDTYSYGLCVKDDGTVLYGHDGNRGFRKFTFNTPFTPSAGFVTGNNYDLENSSFTLDTMEDILSMDPEGKWILATAGTTDDYLVCFRLTVPWNFDELFEDDYDNWTYATRTSLSGDSNMGGACFNRNGTALLWNTYAGASNATSYTRQYTLSTPYDVSTAVLDSTWTHDSAVYSLTVHPASGLLVTIDNAENISFYSPDDEGSPETYTTTPLDITSLNFTSAPAHYMNKSDLPVVRTSLDVADRALVEDFTFEDHELISSTTSQVVVSKSYDLNFVSGDEMSLANSSFPLGESATVTSHTPSQPSTDITSGISDLSQSFSDTNNIDSIFIDKTGTYLFTVGNNTLYDEIYRYTLSTPWDVSTAGSQQVSSLGVYYDNLTWIWVSDDGKKIWTKDNSGSVVEETILGTPWDVTTASVPTNSHSVGSMTHGFFSPDGTKFYKATGVDVVQETLSTPYDIATGTVDYTLTAANLTINAQVVVVSPDGTKFLVSSTAGVIRQYSMSTPWDLSTWSYDSLTTTQSVLGNSVFWSSYQFDKLYTVNSTDTINTLDISSSNFIGNWHHTINHSTITLAADPTEGSCYVKNRSKTLTPREYVDTSDYLEIEFRREWATGRELEFAIDFPNKGEIIPYINFDLNQNWQGNEQILITNFSANADSVQNFSYTNGLTADADSAYWRSTITSNATEGSTDYVLYDAKITVESHASTATNKWINNAGDLVITYDSLDFGNNVIVIDSLGNETDVTITGDTPSGSGADNSPTWSGNATLNTSHTGVYDLFLHFFAEGTKVVYRNSTGNLAERSLSTAYDLTSYGSETEYTIASILSGSPATNLTIGYIQITKDGRWLLLTDSDQDSADSTRAWVSLYSLTTPFDLSTMTFDSRRSLEDLASDAGISYTYSSSHAPRALMSQDGKKITWTTGGSGFDQSSIMTASLDEVFDLSLGETSSGVSQSTSNGYYYLMFVSPDEQELWTYYIEDDGGPRYFRRTDATGGVYHKFSNLGSQYGAPQYSSVGRELNAVSEDGTQFAGMFGDDFLTHTLSSPLWNSPREITGNFSGVSNRIVDIYPKPVAPTLKIETQDVLGNMNHMNATTISPLNDTSTGLYNPTAGTITREFLSDQVVDTFDHIQIIIEADNDANITEVEIQLNNQDQV